jgi:hypothetical protein
LPDSPGTGTLTLKVVAEAQGRDSGPGTYETDFVATVTDSMGAPVSGAVVTFDGVFGRIVLLEDGLSAGTYAATRDGYEPGSYTLLVIAGADSVVGVTTHAPAVHTVTSPAAGDTVTADTALHVRWTRPSLADECRLETRDYDSSWVFGDPGNLWTPTIGNPARTDQRVRVKRRNVQIANGGLAGSQLSVRIRRTVEPVIAR